MVPLKFNQICFSVITFKRYCTCMYSTEGVNCVNEKNILRQTNETNSNETMTHCPCCCCFCFVGVSMLLRKTS